MAVTRAAHLIDPLVFNHRPAPAEYMATEQRGMRTLEHWLAHQQLPLPYWRPPNEDNGKYGDALWAPPQSNAELKTTSVDPERYESFPSCVWHLSRNEQSRNGLPILTTILEVEPGLITTARYQDLSTYGDRGFHPLRPATESMGLNWMAMDRCDWMFVVNPGDTGPARIYAWSQLDFYDVVINAMYARNWALGPGAFNDDGMCLWLPHAPWRWVRRDGAWRYDGTVRMEPQLEAMRHSLEVREPAAGLALVL